MILKWTSCDWALVVTLLISGSVLLFTKATARNQLTKWAMQIGLLVALAIGIKSSSGLYEVAGLAPLFATILLFRNIISTEEIIEDRKPETYWYLLFITFLSRLALASENYVLTISLVAAILGVTTLIVGMPFRNRIEGEAMNKAVYHWLIFMITALGGLFLILAYGSSYNYSAIHDFVFKSEATNLEKNIVEIFLLLPIWAASGVFPFHFFTIDRDSGAAWSLQAVFSVVVTGCLVLVLFKFQHQIFYRPDQVNPHPILRLMLIMALVGSIWGALGALTQKNIQRLLAFMVSAIWPAIIATQTQPSSNSITATILGFIVLTFGLSLVFWTLRIISEGSQKNTIEGIGGMGRNLNWQGAAFLGGAAIILSLPPFAGYAWRVSSLVALFEQKNLLILSIYILSIILMAAAMTRLLVVFYFAETTTAAMPNMRRLQFGRWDEFFVFVSLGVIFYIGTYWDALREHLLTAAKPFVIF